VLQCRILHAIQHGFGKKWLNPNGDGTGFFLANNILAPIFNSEFSVSEAKPGTTTAGVDLSNIFNLFGIKTYYKPTAETGDFQFTLK
jgi:hypothetical protein